MRGYVPLPLIITTLRTSLRVRSPSVTVPTQIIQEVNYEQEGFQFLRVFGFDSDAGRDDYEQITQDLCPVLYAGWDDC
jgi:hypothetical protein